MSDRSIFLAALEIADPSQREAYLNQACAGDAQLRQHIDELLAAEAKLGEFLVRPHADVERTDEFGPVVERPGSQIGPYKLMEQIGEGGFGLVFVAEQQQPVRRKVALKVIKPGMDSREVIARFEAERQALALMDHPHIARVLDAGTTESSRPYFVMELVRGVPITEYCDVNHFTPRQRLALFVDVCHAVQHAHQKGVIHRDLKPSNILVAPHDGVPVVKVIDFGVAKALGQQLTEKTVYTRFAQMIGTPLYMSPEQAEINALDVDTRSDVYSLGVLLYELLTGTTPFDKKRLASAAFDEIRRIIREEEPAPPSTRVSTLGEALASVSTQRGTDPKKLGQVLRGDLDVIVMKALEKERGRRYDTPNALGDDIQRYLRDEAIVARPASTAYRVRKFVRRNWIGVTTCSAIAAALLLGTVVSTWMAVRENRASRLANDRLREVSEQRRAALLAKEDAERAKAEEAKQRRFAEEREAEAKAAKQSEAEARVAAEQERDKATALSTDLQKQKEQQRQLLYAAQMNLIQKAWEADNVARVQELLNAVGPRPGDTDLRSIEWHYWQRMLHQEERGFQLPVRLAQSRRTSFVFDGPDGSTSSTGEGLAAAAARFSPDGTRLAIVRSSELNAEGVPLLEVWNTETGDPQSANTVNLQPESQLAARGTKYSRGYRQPSSYRILFLDAERVVLARQTQSTSAQAALSKILGQYRTASPDERRSLEEEYSRIVEENRAVTHVQTYSLAAPASSESPQPSRFDVVGHLAISPDGSRIAAFTSKSSNDDSTPGAAVLLLDGRTGAEVKRVTSPYGQASVEAVSDDGMRVVLRNYSYRLAERQSLEGSGIGSPPQGPPSVLTDLRQLAVLDVAAEKLIPLQLSAARGWDAGMRPSENESSARSVANSAFSPDGSRLAVVFAADGPTCVFDTATGKELSSLPSQFTRDGRVLASQPTPFVAFSPDGRWLACSAGIDPNSCKLTLWDIAGDKAGPVIKGHTSVPNVAAFSADGNRIFVGDAGGTVKVWRVPDYNEFVAQESSRGRRPFPRGIVLSGDGRWAARSPSLQALGIFPFESTASLELQLEDQTGQVPTRRITLQHTPTTATFNRDGSLLAVVTMNEAAPEAQASELSLWNVTTATQVPGIAASFAAGEFTVGSPGNADNTASRVRRRFNLAFPVFSPSGRRLAVAAPVGTRGPEQRLELRLWDLDRNLPLATHQLPFDVAPGPLWNYTIDFSPDDALLLFANWSNSRFLPPTERQVSRKFLVIDASAGTVRWEEDSGGITPAFSGDGKRLVGLTTQENANNRSLPALIVWDSASGDEIARIAVTGNRSFTSLAVNHDGTRIAAVGTSGVAVYDTVIRSVIYSMNGPIRQVAFTPDGRRMVTSTVPNPMGSSQGFGPGPASLLGRGPDEETRIWDAATGQELLSISTQSPLFTAMLPSSGMRLAPLSAQADAESLVQRLAAADVNGNYLSRKQIAERIKSDTSISDETRVIALRLMPARVERAATLASQALAIAREPGRSRKEYELALEWIQEAVEENPTSAISTNGLGMTLYRLGDYAGALAAFGRSEKLREVTDQPAIPANFGFAAMAHYQLGHAEEARKAFYQADRQGSPRRETVERNGFSSSTNLMRTAADDSLDEVATLLGLQRAAPLIIKGLTLRQNGQLDEAIAQFDAAIRIDPENPAPYSQRALTWRSRGDFDKAIEDYTLAIRFDPNNSQLYADRAYAWQQKLDDDKALDDFTAAIRINPRNSNALAIRGDIWRKKGNLQQALADFDEAIRVNVRHHWAFANRGGIWHDKGEFVRALKDFDEAIRLAPGVARYFHARGYTWLILEHSDQAIQDFDEAIRLDARYAAAYSNRGVCHMRQGDFELALADLHQAVQLTPTAAAYYTNRAGVYVMLGRFTEAHADLDEALRKDPKLVPVHFWRGYAWDKQGESEKSASAYEAFFAPFPKPIDAYRDRADRLLRCGEHAKAIADYREVLALSPDDARAQNNIAWLMAASPDASVRNGKEAIERARKVCEHFEWKQAWPLDTLAAAYAEAGEFAEAIKYQEQAIALSQLDVEKAQQQAQLALYREGQPYRIPRLGK